MITTSDLSLARLSGCGLILAAVLLSGCDQIAGQLADVRPAPKVESMLAVPGQRGVVVYDLDLAKGRLSAPNFQPMPIDSNAVGVNWEDYQHFYAGNREGDAFRVTVGRGTQTQAQKIFHHDGLRSLTYRSGFVYAAGVKTLAVYSASAEWKKVQEVPLPLVVGKVACLNSVSDGPLVLAGKSGLVSFPVGPTDGLLGEPVTLRLKNETAVGSCMNGREVWATLQGTKGQKLVKLSPDLVIQAQVKLPFRPGAALICSEGNLCVGEESGQRLAIFDHELKPIAGSPFAVGQRVDWIADFPPCSFLFFSDRQKNQVSVWSESGQGRLVKIQQLELGLKEPAQAMPCQR